jgi:hypothetical protein
MAYAGTRADAIYTEGPETLTARATQIVAGPVFAYSKQVLSTSEPRGPSAIPLKWIAAGRVDNPLPLKGRATGPFSFTREEGSVLIADTLDMPSWELEYGEVRPSGQVVLFFGSDPAKPVLGAVANAEGELDLASLVRDIVAIQSSPPDAQVDRWLAYIETARTNNGREAALRSLVRMDADWKRMRPALERLLAKSSLNEQIRGFTFGIVVFGLSHQKWAQNQVSVADFLGEQFELARAPKLALQYILSLKLALRFAMEEASSEEREPVRKRIVDSLKRSEPVVSRAPELAEQYRQIRAAYPSLF